MKKSSLLLIVITIITTIAAIISYKKYADEKAKWSNLSAQLGDCTIGEEYKVLFLDTNSKCDYIVLKKKSAKPVPLTSQNKLVAAEEKGKYLDSASAIDMIRNFNEKYNHDLNNTAAVDFDNETILKFLIDRKLENEDLKYLRIYFGLHDSNAETELKEKCTAILVVAKDREEILNVVGKETMNYGGLCPPPIYKEQIAAAGFTLLTRAIETSNDSSHIPAEGSTRIIVEP